MDIMPATKISGYLEKKGRAKMLSCFKRYWFVLEGRLLLYYKSKDEYDALSPCKGTINLGPTCNVKPCPASGTFKIESKTSTITMKADTKEDQQKWMQALRQALNQSYEPTKLNHFRYCVAEIVPMQKSIHASTENMSMVEKLRKMGAKTYGIDPAMSLTSSLRASRRTKSYSDRDSVMVENEEYGRIFRSKSIESEDYTVYETIPSRSRFSLGDEGEMTENNLYCRSSNVYATIDVDINENTLKDQDENIYAELEEAQKWIVDAKAEPLKPQPKSKKPKKSESFLKRVWNRKPRKAKNPPPNESTTINPKIELSDDQTIKTLNELSNILRNQSSVKLRDIDRVEKSKDDVETSNEMFTQTDPPYQTIPFKHEETEITSEYAQPKTLTKTKPPAVPPKKNKKTINSSIEDILKDLEKVDKIFDEGEEISKEGKVKDLIIRFSTPQEDVQLRKLDKPTDLDQLLDELSKITRAPLITPRDTNSMVEPNIYDKELDQLVPARRRTLSQSESDYDVPRPHTSLINLPKKEDSVLEATRFFGPVIKLTERPSTPPIDYNSFLPSITPDSLEVDSNASFQSHKYLDSQLFIMDRKKCGLCPGKHVHQDRFMDSLEIN